VHRNGWSGPLRGFLKNAMVNGSRRDRRVMERSTELGSVSLVELPGVCSRVSLGAAADRVCGSPDTRA